MLRTRATDRTSFRVLARAYSTRGTESGSRSNGHHAAHPAPGQNPQGQKSLNTSPSIDLEAFRSRLREGWSLLSSTSLRQRADKFSKKATTSFSHLGQHLNRVTGYEDIEALKRRVVEQEARIKASRRAARDAKTAYDDAVHQRSISQRQVNDLLQRKSSWTDSDVGRFTSLVRSDHSFEQEEARAKARVVETEDAVDREFSELMKVILARYHEEQVWSDKIRSASTYGSLAVLGVNLVVFIMAIIVVEPWKRKRLAQTFEKKVEELGVETKAVVNAGMTRLEERLTEHEKALSKLVAQVSAEVRQGHVTADMASKKPSPEETAMIPASAPSSRYLPYIDLDLPLARELMVVAGSAFAGGVMMFLTLNYSTP